MTVDYERFVKQLKHPDGADLLKRLQDFLFSFNNGSKMLAFQRKLVVTFLGSITKLSLESQVFRDIITGEIDTESIEEGWEKLVMSQVYDKVFNVANTEETRVNSSVHEKMVLFSWIEPRHLDITINFSLGLEIASAELLKLNAYKSPRDKLIVLLNLMQLVAGNTCE